ncbi:DUF6234 family protein [Yinghuangia soli]|uniref:DUF6234 family protein n=1 Tax=Yinghuangia soli TaxID=2908204 RepID=A0AA41Q503_9ACTN|nr:DUF6234 family protein [Yinghuangia soli]MCF2531653.1 DUF6234 family protein [Yinghuangia soli]
MMLEQAVAEQRPGERRTPEFVVFLLTAVADAGILAGGIWALLRANSRLDGKALTNAEHHDRLVNSALIMTVVLVLLVAIGIALFVFRHPAVGLAHLLPVLVAAVLLLQVAVDSGDKPPGRPKPAPSPASDPVACYGDYNPKAPPECNA